MPAVVVQGERRLSVRDAADRLEVSQDHVRALVRAGTLRGDRESGPLLISEDSVEEYRRRRGYWNPGGVRGGRAAAEREGVQLGVVIKRGGRNAAG